MGKEQTKGGEMKRKNGTGSIYQRDGSSVWWIKYHRHGRAFRESTGTKDEKKAGNMLKTRLAEINQNTFVGPKIERTKVDELAEMFLRDYRINQRKSIDDVKARWDLHLKPFFGGMRAVDVTSEQLARYIDKRQHEQAANATINRELAALKRMFRIGQQSTPPKVMRVPKFAKLVENNVRKGFLEDGQYRKLIEYCPDLWFRGLVECGRTYGWRISELLTMRVSQVDVSQRTIRLNPGTTKNHDGREVIMTDSACHLLTALVHGKDPDDYVFTRDSGKPVKIFRRTWQKACEHAGIPNLLFHDLRRTGARNLRRAGVAEGVIMKIGGWRTRSVFERYAIVSRTDMADAILKLQESERRAEQEQLEKQAAEAQRSTQSGHSEAFLEQPTASKAVN
jgi:integrase